MNAIKTALLLGFLSGLLLLGGELLGGRQGLYMALLLAVKARSFEKKDLLTAEEFKAIADRILQKTAARA